jgi:hypothetical protein
VVDLVDDYGLLWIVVDIVDLWVIVDVIVNVIVLCWLWSSLSLSDGHVAGGRRRIVHVAVDAVGSVVVLL